MVLTNLQEQRKIRRTCNSTSPRFGYRISTADRLAEAENKWEEIKQKLCSFECQGNVTPGEQKGVLSAKRFSKRYKQLVNEVQNVSVDSAELRKNKRTLSTTSSQQPLKLRHQSPDAIRDSYRHNFCTTRKTNTPASQVNSLCVNRAINRSVTKFVVNSQQNSPTCSSVNNKYTSRPASRSIKETINRAVIRSIKRSANKSAAKVISKSSIMQYRSAQPTDGTKVGEQELLKMALCFKCALDKSYQTASKATKLAGKQILDESLDENSNIKLDYFGANCLTPKNGLSTILGHKSGCNSSYCSPRASGNLAFRYVKNAKIDLNEVINNLNREKNTSPEDEVTEDHDVDTPSRKLPQESGKAKLLSLHSVLSSCDCVKEATCKNGDKKGNEGTQKKLLIGRPATCRKININGEIRRKQPQIKNMAQKKGFSKVGVKSRDTTGKILHKA